MPAEPMPVPEIDRELCNLCGRCISECPTSAARWVQGRPEIVRALDCVYCGICEDVCPQGAVTLVFEIIMPAGASTNRRNGESRHR
ncbi:MAG: ATP-binding protein [Anaerolineae bacterium]|jgi:ferredoxin